jgi:hypothetical protein
MLLKKISPVSQIMTESVWDTHQYCDTSKMKKMDWYPRPHLEEPHFTCMHATQSKLIPKEPPHPVV